MKSAVSFLRVLGHIVCSLFFPHSFLFNCFPALTLLHDVCQYLAEHFVMDCPIGLFLLFVCPVGWVSAMKKLQMEVTRIKMRYIWSFIHVPVVGTVNLTMHCLLSCCPRSTLYLRKQFEYVITLSSRLQAAHYMIWVTWEMRYVEHLTQPLHYTLILCSWYIDFVKTVQGLIIMK